MYREVLTHIVWSQYHSSLYYLKDTDVLSRELQLIDCSHQLIKPTDKIYDITVQKLSFLSWQEVMEHPDWFNGKVVIN